MPHDFGVGNAQPHPPRLLIEAGIGNQFAQHLAVETYGFRFVRRQRPLDPIAGLMHPVVEGLAEYLDRNFDVADLGQRRATEVSEDVVDPPQREHRGQQTHDHAHDDAAEPIGGGFADTSKH